MSNTRSWTARNTIDPKKILKLAKQAPSLKPQVHGLIQYARAAEVLRRKGYKWKDVAQWFVENGMEHISPSNISSAVSAWGKTDDYIAFCAEEDKEAELAKVSEANRLQEGD